MAFLATGGDMETKTFLQKALSSDGYFCLFAARSEDGRRVQKFYDSVDALVDAASNFDDEGFDVYYGLATFNEGGSRKLDNVKQLSSFFLDLDCGPSKDFVSQEVAIKALRQFCTKHKLPTPTLVNSGRGVHVYWFLSEPVCYADWYPVAERLKRLCAEDSFDADPAVTSDGARVLRVPHTHNYKTVPPSPVGFFGLTGKFETVDFDAFSALLGEDVIPVPTVYAPQEMSEAMKNLLGNNENVFKDILIKTQNDEGCAQIAYIVRNQESMSEPMWRAGLSIAKFCTDAGKAIHLISHKHPDYTPRDTLKKVDQIRGPYTCAKFDEFRPNVCKGCPLWGQIKSPIVLGKRLKEAEVGADGNYVDTVVEAPALELPTQPVQQYVIPKYPPPYVRGANGGVYVRTENDDGQVEEVRIYRNDLYVVKRVDDPEAGESLVMRLHLPMDGVREFTVPMTAASSRDEYRKMLAMKGVSGIKMDHIMAYTDAWINELQAKSIADTAHHCFGWTNSDMDAFVLGNQKITATSIEFNPPSTKTVGLFPAFEPKGTLEGWKEALELWNDQQFTLQQFALGMGFGSVLMEMLNVSCGTVSFYNKESGVGKTALLQAAVGIWGNPKELILDKDDTVNFKMNRSEVYHSLPFPLDEITNMTPKQMSDLVYQGTSGKQRGRMSASANVERHRSGSWSLLMMYTANTSIVERISMAKAMPKAEAQRVLECRVERIFDEVSDKEITDAFEAALQSNYGHAGPIFVQYLMRNKDACRKLLFDVQKRVDTVGQLTAENRFWSGTIAATITGLLIAQKAGLHNYPVQNVFKWATSDLIAQNKRTSRDMDGSVFDIMDDFFSENISCILQIKSTLDNRGTQGNGLDDLVIPEQVARGRLIARYETDTKLFFVKPKPLKEWCGELQINYQHLISEIMQHCSGKRGKVRLTKGTHLQLPASDVIIMKFDAGQDEQVSEDISDL